MNARILMYALCLGAGFAGGYLVAKKQLEQYYADLADEEIESVKEVWRNKAGFVPVQSDSDAPEEVKSLLGAPKKIDTNRTPYHSLAGKYQTEPEEEIEAVDIPKLVDAPINPEHAYQITPEEFAGGFGHHDKVSLQYYYEDDTLIDEREQVLENVDLCVGDCLSEFSEDLETNTIWVRNERLGVDYEIDRINASFLEAVMGHDIGAPTSAECTCGVCRFCRGRSGRTPNGRKTRKGSVKHDYESDSFYAE